MNKEKERIKAKENGVEIKDWETYKKAKRNETILIMVLILLTFTIGIIIGFSNGANFGEEQALKACDGFKNMTRCLS